MNLRPRYDVILGATDFSPLSLAAVRAAGDLANLFGAELLHLLHVRSPTDLYGTLAFGSDASAALERFERESVAEAQQELERIPLEVPPTKVRRMVRVGGAIDQIARTAREVRADLIVMGTHGRSAVGRLLLGSVASGLIRAAHCPVLVFHEERATAKALARVLAAVDLSAVSSAVLAHAGAFATSFQGRVDAVSSYEFPMTIAGDGRAADAQRQWLFEPAEHDKALADLVARAEISAEHRAHSVVGRATPARVILDLARDTKADLIVVGTSGHSGLERVMLGSTATKVVAQADCPVLVVPKPT